MLGLVTTRFVSWVKVPWVYTWRDVLQVQSKFVFDWFTYFIWLQGIITWTYTWRDTHNFRVQVPETSPLNTQFEVVVKVTGTRLISFSFFFLWKWELDRKVIDSRNCFRAGTKSLNLFSCICCLYSYKTCLLNLEWFCRDQFPSKMEKKHLTAALPQYNNYWKLTDDVKQRKQNILNNSVQQNKS